MHYCFFFFPFIFFRAFKNADTFSALENPDYKWKFYLEEHMFSFGFNCMYYQ